VRRVHHGVGDLLGTWSEQPWRVSGVLHCVDVATAVVERRRVTIRVHRFIVAARADANQSVASGSA
jgi:hypothetical protein